RVLSNEGPRRPESRRMRALCDSGHQGNFGANALIIETLAALIGLAASTGSVFYGIDGFLADPPGTELTAEAPPEADPSAANPSAASPLVTPFIRPAPSAGPAVVSLPERQKVNWTGLLVQELRFLALEHSF